MNDKVKEKKTATSTDIEWSAARGLGNYEKKRIEKRIENGKIESAGRIVDPVTKKVYSMHKGPNGKIIKLTEELGEVQRKGIDLSQKDQNKLKLLGVKQAAKGGMINKYAKGGSVKKKNKMATTKGWGASRKT